MSDLTLPPVKIKHPKVTGIRDPHVIKHQTPRTMLNKQTEVLWQLVCYPRSAAKCEEATEMALPHSIYHPSSAKELICLLRGSRATDVNKYNDHGYAPIHSLIKYVELKGKQLQSIEQRRNELVFALLANSNADVNILTRCSQRLSPLHLAAEAGDENCVKLLLAFGADINVRDARDRTPLEVIGSGLLRIKYLLLKLGGLHRLEPPSQGCRKIRQIFKRRLSSVAEKHTDSLFTMSARPLCGLGTEGIEIKKMGDCRVLCLDGGGIRGLVQIEVLCELEKATGHRITELFDWVVGTSTGALILLAVIYGKKSLQELQQLYFGLKDKVITNNHFGFAFNSEALEEAIVDYIGKSVRMGSVKHPKVLVTAVNKRTSRPELHIFNNCFDNQFSDELVWKVARYTSAAPMYFTEFENYVDGGVLANNPCDVGLTAIQNYIRVNEPIRSITLVVSVGSGLCSGRCLGSTNIQEYFQLGKQWLNPGGFKERAKNLFLLMGNALADSELVTQNCQCRCEEQGIHFFRFNPCLEGCISLGETNIQKLVDMIIETQLQTPQQGLYELVHQLLT